MHLASRIELYCQKRVAQCFSRKRARAGHASPIVSFTFDDFPRSALIVGGEILAKKGLRGTYYASMGLMGRRSEQGDMYTAKDLQTLVDSGHELACHTFSHLFCPRSANNKLQQECERNRQAVAEVLDGYKLRNFSFPSGGITRSSKVTVTSIYDTCRTIEPGINCNTVDLGFLRANSIYSSRITDRLYQLIDNNVRRAGWLIFYTHDVSDQPSSVGCTPAYFRDILQAAIASGATIMTVAETASRFYVQAN